MANPNQGVNLFLPDPNRGTQGINSSHAISAINHAAPPITGMATPAAAYQILGDMFQNIGKTGEKFIKTMENNQSSQTLLNLNQSQYNFQKDILNEKDPIAYAKKLQDFKSNAIKSVSDNTFLSNESQQKYINGINQFSLDQEQKIQKMAEMNDKINLISAIESMGGEISLMDKEERKGVYERNSEMIQDRKNNGQLSEAEYTKFKNTLDYQYDKTSLDVDYNKSLTLGSIKSLNNLKNTLEAKDEDGSPMYYKNITAQERLQKLLSIPQNITDLQFEGAKNALKEQKSMININHNFNDQINDIRKSGGGPLALDAIESVRHDLIKDPVGTIEKYYPQGRYPERYNKYSQDGNKTIDPGFVLAIQRTQGISNPSILSQDRKKSIKDEFATSTPEQKEELFNYYNNKFDRYKDYFVDSLKDSEMNPIDKMALSIEDPKLRNELFTISHMENHPDEQKPYGKDIGPDDIKARENEAIKGFNESEFGLHLFNNDKKKYDNMAAVVKSYAASPFYQNKEDVEKFYKNINIIETPNMKIATDMDGKYVKSALQSAQNSIAEKFKIPPQFTNVLEWSNDGDNNFKLYMNVLGEQLELGSVNTLRAPNGTKQLDLNNIQYHNHLDDVNK